MAEMILTGAKVVGPDVVIEGAVVVRDGRIAEVARGASRAGEDFDGDYLLPGLVELHTDNMERHFAPRPGVRWPGVWSITEASFTVGSSISRAMRSRTEG